MKKAIQEQNETDLELALDDLKNLGLASLRDDIQYGENELNVMRCRRGRHRSFNFITNYIVCFHLTFALC